MRSIFVLTSLLRQGGAIYSLSEVTEIDFDWPRRFWNSLSEEDQSNLIRYVTFLYFEAASRMLFVPSNVIGHLGAAPTYSVRERQVAIFNHVNSTLGQAIGAGVGVTSIPQLVFSSTDPTWPNTTIPSDNSTLYY